MLTSQKSVRCSHEDTGYRKRWFDSDWIREGVTDPDEANSGITNPDNRNERIHQRVGIVKAVEVCYEASTENETSEDLGDNVGSKVIAGAERAM